MVLALNLGTKIGFLFFFYACTKKSAHTIITKKTFKYLKFIGGFGWTYF